ncbi:MAG: hypothetical protein JWN50_669 [Parcubacteria group bacterium]|nr:hypothetical protein [Parcubacteria group bacterium]
MRLLSWAFTLRHGCFRTKSWVFCRHFGIVHVRLPDERCFGAAFGAAAITLMPA